MQPAFLTRGARSQYITELHVNIRDPEAPSFDLSRRVRFYAAARPHRRLLCAAPPAASNLGEPCHALLPLLHQLSRHLGPSCGRIVSCRRSATAGTAGSPWQVECSLCVPQNQSPVDHAWNLEPFEPDSAGFYPRARQISRLRRALSLQRRRATRTPCSGPC